MEIKRLSPQGGDDALRLGDSDDLIVVKKFGGLPPGQVMLEGEKSAISFCPMFPK